MTRFSQPLIPDYGGACIANVMPELVKSMMGRSVAAWVPQSVVGSKQIVLLVLDGLGWTQLQDRSAMMPTLTGFEGDAITSVAPTTTTACLTSIVTGRPPAIHGILGYRLSVHDDVLNVLAWANQAGEPFEGVVPEEFQTHPAFAANPVPVVTRRHFIGSGFTRAHMQGARLVGYAAPSSLPVEIWRLIKAGEPLVYAYYDGIDTIAHLHGFGEHYEAEMYTVDRLVRDVLAGLPEGCTLVVTADHGQVEVGDNQIELDPQIVARCTAFSGEGRFRWLHTRDESETEVIAAQLAERHGDQAWIVTKSEMIQNGWYGGPLSERFSSRIGDVALVAREAVAFRDPSHDGERQMACRHGSLTPAEMLVPLLAQRN